MCTLMKKSRYAFGICSMGNSIYVVGGLGKNHLEKRKEVEVYDTLKDKWIEMPEANLQSPEYGMTLMPI